MVYRRSRRSAFTWSVVSGLDDTTVMPDAVDVSQSFYIDNNGTPDMVGQAYLYRTPSSQVNLTNYVFAL